MHLSRSKATAPSAVLYNAPGVGQIFMQPASSQCMHRLLTKSQRTGFSSEGTSLYWMRFKAELAKSGGFWYVPLFCVWMPGSWFQDLQAT
jgi:hypothetical protein